MRLGQRLRHLTEGDVQIHHFNETTIGFPRVEQRAAFAQRRRAFKSDLVALLAQLRKALVKIHTKHDVVIAGTALFQHLREYRAIARSEEHTSELQSLMRISYAVFCLKKKKKQSKKKQREHVQKYNTKRP